MNKKSKKWIFPLLIWLIILGIASPHVLTSIKHLTYEKGTAIVELSTYDHIQEETFANRKSNYKINRTDLVLDINGEKVSCYIYDKKRYDEGTYLKICYPKDHLDDTPVILKSEYYNEMFGVIYVFFVMLISLVTIISIPILGNNKKRDEVVDTLLIFSGLIMVLMLVIWWIVLLFI